MKKSKWNLKKQALFLQKLSDLLEEGYSLNEAISFTSLHLTRDLKADAQKCTQLLAQGNPFRVALRELGFHRQVLSFLYFAENYGDVKRALKESSRLLNLQLNHLEKAKQVLRYPLFLLTVILAILYTVEFIVAPQFKAMYQSMNVQTTVMMLILLSMFDFVFFTFMAMILLCLIAILYYYFYFRHISPKTQMRIIMRIPFIRRFLSLYNSYYFSFQLSFLLKGGLSIFESLSLFYHQPLLPIFKEEAERIIEQLTNGKRFSDIMRESLLFEQGIADVIYHGQAIGKLDRELYTYSQLLLSSLEESVLKVISYIQPIIFFIIGILVLMVYLSVMLPMYRMIESI